MENLIKNKVGLLLVLAVLLLLVAGLFLYLQPEGVNILTGKRDVAEKDFKLETKDTPSSAILTGFPKDLPMEAGSKVLQSYESDSGNGRLQSTKKFTTTLSVSVALEKYTSFFKDTGWLQTDSDVKTSPITLIKKNDTVMVVATNDPDNGTVVEITILQNQH